MRKDAALLAAMIAALLLFTAAPARAGTYDVLTCNVDGAQAANLAWTFEPYNSAGKGAPERAKFTLGDPTKCAPAVGAQFTTLAAARAVRVDDGAAWTFRAPSGTTVKRVQIWRHGMARASTDNPATAPVENGWWNVMARAGDGPGGRVMLSGEICSGALPAPTYCQTGGPFTAASFAIVDVGEPVVSWGVQCAGPALTSWCFTGDGTTFNAEFELQAARVTVEDLAPPALEPGLPAGGVRRASDPVAASATDSAGVRSLRVLVDGNERFAERPACDYRRPAPCPGSASGTYDLTGVADGFHTITTLAEDAATNLTRLDRTVVVDSTPPVIDRVPVSGRTISALVADATSAVTGGTIEVRRNAKAAFAALPTALRGGKLIARIPKPLSPSKVGIRVSAVDSAGNAVTSLVTSMSLSTRTGRHFHKVRNARARVPYGRAVQLAGRLTTTDGMPVAHQPIVVTGVLRRTGARPELVTTAVTDTGGRFRFTVPAGPSRTLTVAYAGNPGVLRRSRTASLRVPARATIHATRRVLHGTGTVRFRGRLQTLGAALPPGGKIVELQAAQRGHWTTVATTRAKGPNATWHARARFRGTPGRYPVRLRIRREAAFPYERGYSRAVPIRVR